jgi:hypothetical protein
LSTAANQALTSHSQGVVRIEWLAIRYQPTLSWDLPIVQRYFTVSPQPGIAKSLGMRSDAAIIPHALIPKDGFHRLTTRRLPGRNFEGELLRVPYPVILEGHRTALIKSITSRLYPLGFQTVRVAAEIPLSNSEDLKALFADLHFLRKPHSVKAASHVIRQAFALATGEHKVSAPEISYNTFFGMELSLPIDKAGMHSFASVDYSKELVGLLIGSSEIESLGSQLVDRVIKNNYRLNEKSSSEYILTNRGGLVYAVPSVGYKSPHPGRFKRALELSELALYAASFLDLAGEAAHTHQRLVYFLLSRIRGWIDAPDVVFPASTTSQLHWGTLSNSLSLTKSLLQWERVNGVEPEELRELWRQVPADWWRIAGFADALDRLGSRGSQLGFIEDEEMRVFVEGDLIEARTCLSTGNYKASLVMAGASVEAVLLAILEDNADSARRNKLRKMQLFELIEEACPDWRNPNSSTGQKRLISKNVAALLDTSCRPWRNLIHPGVSIRKNISVTQTMASAALAALDLLIEECSQKHPS